MGAGDRARLTGASFLNTQPGFFRQEGSAAFSMPEKKRREGATGKVQGRRSVQAVCASAITA